jgi:hypothetical protein
MKDLTGALVLLGLLFGATSCQDNDDASDFQSTAQFTQSTLSFPESDGQHQISLSLNIPAGSDGQIVLSASALTSSSFVTDPSTQMGRITLPVKKGQALINFNISPVDNKTLDGCKLIKLSIASLSKGLRKGDAGKLVVSVNDDEAPVNADFERNTMSVRENDPLGGQINIVFASPAPADGVVVLKLDSQSKYGSDYVTEPAAVSGKIFLQVAKGAASAVVRVYPVNNDAFTVDRNIYLAIIDATGGLRVGDNDSFWCTITEDDGQTISTIASVRSLQSGDGVLIHNSYIEGIVTSISNVSSGRIVVEDASGALQVQLQPDHTLTRGDVVLLNLDHGLLHLQQGILEVRDVVQFQKLGEETPRINKYSLEDLLRSAAQIQSQTIQLSGVSFTQADGNVTFLGDRTVSDGTSTVIVRTSSLADFGDQPVPTGLLNVTGIFVNVDGQNYIYPQELADIRKGQFMVIRD